MATNQDVIDGANATALVRLATHCAVAGVRLSFISKYFFCQMTNKLLLNSGGRNSDSAWSKMYDLIPRSLNGKVSHIRCLF